MDFLSIFRPAQPAPAPAPQPSPANPAPTAGPQVPPNPQDPSALNRSTNTNPHPQPTPGTSAADPLDGFAELFTLPEVDPNKPVDDPNAPIFSVDPTKLQEQLSGMSFIPADSQQLMAQALQGDGQALEKLLNGVGQAAYLKSSLLTANLADRAVRASVDRSTAGLPAQVRTQLSRSSLSKLNPAFQHKAMEPVVQAIRGQVEQKFPNATPDEVAEQVNNYLTLVAQKLNPNQQQPTDPRHPQHQQAATDFGDFFGFGPSGS